MTTLDKIKLIDFYLHGVDRDLWDFEIPNYDVSLDALRPVIVKLYQGAYCKHISDVVKNQIDYICGIGDFTAVFDSAVECVKYLNEKSNTENV